MGALASFLAVMIMAPPAATLGAEAARLSDLAAIAAFIFQPSLALTLISGLLAIAANPIFHNAGWAWAKAVTGILIFEGGLHAAEPLQTGAKAAAAALAAKGPLGPVSPDLALAGGAAERNTLWLLMAVSLANVVLGIWRPRFTRLR